MNVLAMYLPQFHRVRENDEWWGEGFTEWTTVKNAKKFFPNHYQPHEPLSYYDLLEKNTMKQQEMLMHKYAVDGMCFYHYYFEKGRKILEKPAENLLKWKDVDMPFCFYWANESWKRSWSDLQKGNVWSEIYENSERKGTGILLNQQYGDEKEWKEHINYLLPFFKDERYIKINGRPVFIIYNIDDIVYLEKMKKCWNSILEKEGMEHILLVGKNTQSQLVEFSLQHEPQLSFSKYITQNFNNTYGVKRIIDYDEVWDYSLKQRYRNNLFLGGFVGYDDSPRRGKNGIIIDNATPDKFRDNMIRLLIKAERNHCEYVFINAWNEWGEGMHLEPDQKWQYGYLEALREARRFVEKNKAVICECVEDAKESEASLNDNLGVLVNSEDNRKWKTMHLWMENKIAGKELSEYLKNKNIKTVAVYGLGYIGDLVIRDLLKSSINIKYGIDMDTYKAGKYKKYNLEVVPPKNVSESVDMIIVTVEYGLDIISEELRKVTRASIISFRELLLEIQKG